MTTYYGVWSGKEWYRAGDGLFHTLSLGVARAQAVIVRGWFPQAIWQARAIGEDGLPIERRTMMWCTPKMHELGEVLELLDPQTSKCVKSLSSDFEGTLVVECTLPLDVETAIGLQIVGQQAETDPGLELTILVSLEEE